MVHGALKCLNTLQHGVELEDEKVSTCNPHHEVIFGSKSQSNNPLFGNTVW